MIEFFIEKRTHKGSHPVAEVHFNATANSIEVETDDRSLITIFKGLATRPMCQVTKTLGAVTKTLADNRFKEMLRHIKRPYFFTDPVERIWKYREQITL